MSHVRFLTWNVTLSFFLFLIIRNSLQLEEARSKKRETGTHGADFISEQSVIEKNVLLYRTKNYINLSLRHSFTIHVFRKKDAKVD